MPENYNIADLAKLMRQAKANDIPFVFFTGAGCSVAAGIPLASELVEEMQTRFETELRSLNDADRQNYGKCMAKIGRHDRRKFLKEYIDDAKINWANIALACILKGGYISRILTFNFDNLLARSCGLLGLYPATYDFTAANLNLYHLIENPAVVHLHGQIHGFSQLNSDKETASHAEQLSEFVRSTLNESPALFIGYSGQADAFFPQITKHYSGQHRLFWVGMEEQAPSYVAESFLQTDLAHYMCCADGGSDVFLIELAQQLGCFPPLILTNPYSQVLKELKTLTDYPQHNRSKHKTSHQSDIVQYGDIIISQEQDILQWTKQRLRKAEQREFEHAKYLKLYFEDKHQEIIQYYKSVEKLESDNEFYVANAYFVRALEMESTDTKQEVTLYKELINNFGKSHTPEIQELVDEALLNVGFSLGESDQELGSLEESVAMYDKLIQRCSERSALIKRDQINMAMALFNKGISLGQLGRSEDEISIYNDLIQQFVSSDVRIVQELVAKALLNKGIKLTQQGHPEDAIMAYNEAIQRFRENNDFVLQEQVIIAMVLLNKGISLNKLGKLEDELKCYDKIIEKFKLINIPVAQELVVKALLNKGITLTQLERDKDAIVVYKRLIRNFGKIHVPTVQEAVIRAKALKKEITSD